MSANAQDLQVAAQLAKLQAKLNKNIIGAAILKERLMEHAQTILMKHNNPKLVQRSSNLALLGDAGTGKTTSVELFFKALKALKLLDGPFVTTSPSCMVHGVQDVYESAKGGLLLIDEAYDLATKHSTVTDLVRVMTDSMILSKPKIVVFAGYRAKMVDFFTKTNEGLRSRVDTTITIENYTVSQLVEVLNKMLKEASLTYDKTDESIKELIRDVMTTIVKKPNCANCRDVLNFVVKIEQAVASTMPGKFDTFQCTVNIFEKARSIWLYEEDIYNNTAVVDGDVKGRGVKVVLELFTFKSGCKNMSEVELFKHIQHREPAVWGLVGTQNERDLATKADKKSGEGNKLGEFRKTWEAILSAASKDKFTFKQNKSAATPKMPKGYYTDRVLVKNDGGSGDEEEDEEEDEEDRVTKKAKTEDEDEDEGEDEEDEDGDDESD